MWSQDPVVFSGSVRDNLDPFNTAGGDALIWQALARSGLQQAISDLPVRCCMSSRVIKVFEFLALHGPARH